LENEDSITSVREEGLSESVADCQPLLVAAQLSGLSWG
jgi:hypothetical protein